MSIDFGRLGKEVPDCDLDEDNRSAPGACMLLYSSRIIRGMNEKHISMLHITRQRL